MLDNTAASVAVTIAPAIPIPPAKRDMPKTTKSTPIPFNRLFLVEYPTPIIVRPAIPTIKPATINPIDKLEKLIIIPLGSMPLTGLAWQ